jgi:hypothetical protein
MILAARSAPASAKTEKMVARAVDDADEFGRRRKDREAPAHYAACRRTEGCGSVTQRSSRPSPGVSQRLHWMALGQRIVHVLP